ncbi:DUF4446 family protein [Pelosinus sp. sgz500959]|uniref:DUF4446 family protein n=1 Tax=Pelosinus sp. sgz500959 TaxID=3242472 RepID=UPI00366EE1BD
MMDQLAELSNLIMSNVQYVLLGMTVMILLALVIFISINIKLAKMNKRYRTMMKGMEGVNVEQMLLAHIDEVKQVVHKVDNLSIECQKLDISSRKAIQKFGVIRFNAFEDMGSDLSFAIALLDYQNNGVIISSIYSRSESHTYAKPIISGSSSYFLTEEEKQALTQAIEKK